jgi:signal peptidase I
MAWDNAQAQQREDYAYEDEQGEHRNFRLMLEVLETAVLTLLLFMVVRLAIQNFKIDGPSMMPTLQDQQYILVDKAEYLLHTPRRGDVIVFHHHHIPYDAFQVKNGCTVDAGTAGRYMTCDYIKRIIGIPGDTVFVGADGVVQVDGVRLNEPYVADLDNPYGPKYWTLGPNQYLVLGDNRGDSSDSRAFGPVPRSDIVGKATLVYFPFGAAHLLHDWSSVFAAIH